MADPRKWLPPRAYREVGTDYFLGRFRETPPTPPPTPLLPNVGADVPPTLPGGIATMPDIPGTRPLKGDINQIVLPTLNPAGPLPKASNSFLVSRDYANLSPIRQEQYKESRAAMDLLASASHAAGKPYRDDPQHGMKTTGFDHRLPDWTRYNTPVAQVLDPRIRAGGTAVQGQSQEGPTRTAFADMRYVEDDVSVHEGMHHMDQDLQIDQTEVPYKPSTYWSDNTSWKDSPFSASAEHALKSTELLANAAENKVVFMRGLLNMMTTVGKFARKKPGDALKIAEHNHHLLYHIQPFLTEEASEALDRAWEEDFPTSNYERFQNLKADPVLGPYLDRGLTEKDLQELIPLLKDGREFQRLIDEKGDALLKHDIDPIEEQLYELPESFIDPIYREMLNDYDFQDLQRTYPESEWTDEEIKRIKAQIPISKAERQPGLVTGRLA